MIMPLLTVNDVDESVAFYRDQLGFELRMTMAPEGKNIFAIVNFGGSDIGLGVDNATPTPKPFAPGVQFMIYLPDDQNIDRYYADVTARGVKTDDEPTDTYWGDR